MNNPLKDLGGTGGLVRPVDKCRFAFFPVHPVIGANNGKEFGSCVLDVKLDMKNKRVTVHVRVPCTDGLYETIHRMMDLEMTLRLKHYRGPYDSNFTLCLTYAKVERHELSMSYDADNVDDAMMHEIEFSYRSIVVEEGKVKDIPDPMPVKAEDEFLTPSEAIERLRKLQEKVKPENNETVESSKE